MGKIIYIEDIIEAAAETIMADLGRERVADKIERLYPKHSMVFKEKVMIACSWWGYGKSGNTRWPPQPK